MRPLTYEGRTHVGRVRDHNEDCFKMVPEAHLFLVADGLGGYAAGEVASRLTVDSIGGYFQAVRNECDLTWPAETEADYDHQAKIFEQAVTTANQRVWSTSMKYNAYRGMGSTIVGLQFVGKRVYTAHVGDSRCYRLRSGVLEQLTRDHSLFNAFRDSGALTAENEDSFPYKNVILRALGTQPKVEVELTKSEWQPGDLYLLCSDGLTGELSDWELMELFQRQPEQLGGLADCLVNEACERGGRDNVTVLLVKVPETREAPFALGSQEQSKRSHRTKPSAFESTQSI